MSCEGNWSPELRNYARAGTINSIENLNTAEFISATCILNLLFLLRI